MTWSCLFLPVVAGSPRPEPHVVLFLLSVSGLHYLSLDQSQLLLCKRACPKFNTITRKEKRQSTINWLGRTWLRPFARSLKMADIVIAFFLLLLLVLWRACNIDLCTRWYGIFQHANTSNKTRRKGSGAYLGNNKRKLGMFITSAEREVKDSRRSANVSKLTFLGQDWARKVSRFSVLFGYLTK